MSVFIPVPYRKGAESFASRREDEASGRAGVLRMGPWGRILPCEGRELGVGPQDCVVAVSFNRVLRVGGSVPRVSSVSCRLLPLSRYWEFKPLVFIRGLFLKHSPGHTCSSPSLSSTVFTNNFKENHEGPFPVRCVHGISAKRLNSTKVWLDKFGLEIGIDLNWD